MQLCDLTYDTPAENLAADETLALQCEAGGPEVLRFWIPPATFVVVGYSNAVASEVNEAACQSDGIPIFRRVTGGGTVLQSPGCLCYTLVLKASEAGPLASVPETNRFIMAANARALSTLVNPSITVEGHTDLAADGRKFSGNAQRRYRHTILFHGSLLLNSELSLISKYLAYPSKTPEYRQGRAHEAFLTNLGAAASAIKSALQKFWEAELPQVEPDQLKLAELVRQKYSRREWNYRC